eukprot:1888146-Prymnesium_polylepis.1
MRTCNRWAGRTSPSAPTSCRASPRTSPSAARESLRAAPSSVAARGRGGGGTRAAARPWRVRPEGDG